MGQASCVKSNSFPARTQWGHSLNGVVLYFIMYVMVKTSSQEQLAGRGSETSLSYQYNFCIKFSHKGAETIQGKKTIRRNTTHNFVVRISRLNVKFNEPE